MEAMPVAYDSYSIRYDAGIPFQNEEHNVALEKMIAQARQKTIDAIIQGRVLNGEPPDLNY